MLPVHHSCCLGIFKALRDRFVVGPRILTLFIPENGLGRKRKTEIDTEKSQTTLGYSLCLILAIGAILENLQELFVDAGNV
jgi:hypothetical protein